MRKIGLLWQWLLVEYLFFLRQVLRDWGFSWEEIRRKKVSEKRFLEKKKQYSCSFTPDIIDKSRRLARKKDKKNEDGNKAGNNAGFGFGK